MKKFTKPCTLLVLFFLLGGIVHPQNPAKTKSPTTQKSVSKKSTPKKPVTKTAKTTSKKSTSATSNKPPSAKKTVVKTDTTHKPPLANDPPKRKQLKAGPNGEKIVTNQKGERYDINKNGNKVYVD